MASKQTNFAVGLFVIIGMIAAVAVIIYVGASSYFTKGTLYATYFDESVQGLSKDSPVKYRGVSVGKVRDIKIAKDAKLIEVILQIDPDWSPQEGITAQLKSIGITGLMFVELDLKQESDELLCPTFDSPSKLPILPTRPSEIQKIMDGLTEIVDQIKGVDLDGVAERLKTTIDSLNATVLDADVDAISAKLKVVIDKAEEIVALPAWRETLGSLENAGTQVSDFAGEAKTTASRVNTLIADNKDQFEEAISQLKETVVQTKILVQHSSSIAGATNESLHQIEKSLAVTIRNLEEASRNISRLADKSAIQPSQLLFASPPPAKKIEE